MAKKRRKRGIPVITIPLILVNILLVLAILAAYLSNIVSPVKAWQLAFAGLALPFIALANLLFILLWLFIRPRFALLSLLILLAGSGILSRYFQLNYPDEFDKHDRHVEVMSYNVHHFNLWRHNIKTDYKTYDAVKEFLLDNTPSVLCLQEAVISHPNSGNLSERLRKELKYDGVFAKPYLTQGVNGLTIYFNGKKTGGGEIKHGNRTIAAYIDLEINGYACRVYNIHLQSIRLSNEEYVMDNLGPDAYKDSLFVINSRQIARKLKYAFIERSIQADLLSKHIEESPHPVVVCGDLNDTPSSYAYSQAKKGLRDAFVQAGKGFGRTYHGKFPSFRIDYIFASRDIQVKSFRIHRKKYSDHYPISSWIEFNDKPL
jgi:endonuclease/exonuclease/phosphatase family metal-dependent hydrolase